MTKKFKTIKDLPVHIEVTPENKCNYCTASICCTYVTQEIDSPRSMEDFDYIYWLVAHKDTSVFKDDDGWFINANNPCSYLKANGDCGIYETRPQICREHDNDSCEFDGPAEEDFELYFDSPEALDKYCRKRFKSWDKRFEKWYKPKKKKDKKKDKNKKDGKKKGKKTEGKKKKSAKKKKSGKK